MLWIFISIWENSIYFQILDPINIYLIFIDWNLLEFSLFSYDFLFVLKLNNCNKKFILKKEEKIKAELTKKFSELWQNLELTFFTKYLRFISREIRARFRSKQYRFYIVLLFFSKGLSIHFQKACHLWCPVSHLVLKITEISSFLISNFCDAETFKESWQRKSKRWYRY